MTRDFSSESRKWLNNYHGSIDATALLLAFDAGAAALIAQLQAAQATIAEARTCLEQSDQGDSFGSIEDILSRADTSALAEHDKRVAERAWVEGFNTGFSAGERAMENGGPDDDDVNPYSAASIKRAEAE